MELEGSLPRSQVPATCPYPEPDCQSRSKAYRINVSQHDTFSGSVVVTTSPNPKLEDHPLSAVRDCLFNTFATTPHIGGRSSIRNLRTRHAVVTGARLSSSNTPANCYRTTRCHVTADRNQHP